ncbi:DUF4175 family protein [Aquidulcibacter sp.]|uniref:DUF4175 family protein n=1 Tax=Aquidulcibacter sp. TaxID=2052990 RepID=UPI0025C6F606|nr:DUF4175 family protein [Aquidulcibacter sp.]MCA3694908.1 DUF4175 family protein [Aquidulcibacter sp.]
MLAPTTPPLSTRRAIARTMRADALVKGLRTLWPPLCLLAIMGAAGSLTEGLPAALVSAGAGLTWLLSAYLFWRGWKLFHPMGEHEAGRALEEAAGLQELRPLTGGEDRRISGDDALWSWHQARLIKAAAALSTPVKPKLLWQDAAKALALMAALGLCWLNPVASVRALTFDLSPLVGDSDLVVEVWAEPPAYTGLPLIRLDRSQSEVSLPVGSKVTARVDGARGAPVLRGPSRSTRLSPAQGAAWQGQIEITRSGTLKLDRLGTRAQWHIEATPDQKPQLSLPKPIQIDPKGRLDIAFQASDDYGLAAAFVRIRPVKVPEGLAGRSVFDTPIPLEGAAGENGARRVFVEVADHALAGLTVEAQIVVRDGLGQETASETMKLTLPERTWQSSLAAALQEVRLLILREARPYQRPLPVFATLFEPLNVGGAASDVFNLGPIKLDLTDPQPGAPPGIAEATRRLEAIAEAMQQLGLSDLGQLSLHYALERLSIARDVADAHSVAPILWEMALQIEASNQTPAQQKIAQAREALKQALEQGATPEEIQQLTQELREAVGERLQELAEQGASGEGGEQGQSGPQISAGDLEDRLRELEESGSSGSREEALAQLDQLDELLENLQPGAPGGSGQANGQGQGGPLDDAMRQQRALSDQTEQLGETPPSDQSRQRAEDLANQQEGLADALGGKRPNDPSQEQSAEDQNRSQAAEAMREAAQALREGDLNRAQDAQARALQALRQAAESSPQGQAGAGGETDPLGRALPKQDDGKATKVPDGVEKRRARDVRDELRRRQADPQRDKTERDYIDRLLQDR